MIHALAGPRLPHLWVKKSCTYSRITNDSQINLSCYLVFLLWYVELKYHLIKSVLKPLKLGALPPGPHQGFALDPDPAFWAPLSTNLRSPSDMYLKLSCMPEKRESYTVFVPIYNYMVYLPVLGFQLLGGLHWALITAITGSEATSLLWTWNCCVSNVSLQC